MKKILIINGPNLNLLGKREPEIYGDVSFEQYVESLKKDTEFELSYFQSNHEGDIIDQIHNAKVSGIILNAGAYTHTSLAIADAIKGVDTPVVEVHISNVFAREEIRHHSMIAPNCVGSISGFGLTSYALALQYFNTL